MPEPQTPRTQARLDARLHAVGDLVPVGSRVADVGTDHGKLALALLEQGRATRCVATELRSTGARRLLEMIRDGSGPAGLSVRFGDGLDPVREDDLVDVVVIAGMGGRTIVRILDRGLARVEPALVALQPQSEHGRVRRWLRDHSWTLVDERLIRDGGHVYLILGARRGSACLWQPYGGLDPEDILEAGPLLVRRRDPVAANWWRVRLERLREIVARLPRDRGRTARVELERAGRVVGLLRSVEPPESLL